MTTHQKLIRDLAARKFGRKSSDPRHASNREDADWQSGYFLGCLTERSVRHDLGVERFLRNCKCLGTERENKLCRASMDRLPAWKAGYWAGRYSRL